MKTIPCPVHPNGRANWWSIHRHEAVLFEHGEQYAGIWECLITGESDSCEHEERRVETIEVTYFVTPDIDQSYDQEIYVCEACNCTIEDEDPAQDRYEAHVDMEIMEALGK